MHQQQLEEMWQRLLANDPVVTLATLEAAFRDNWVPAVAVNCEDKTVTVVVVMEGVDALPEHRASVTPAGRLTARQLSKTARNELYLQWMSSNVLATVRETLAVAPGIDEVLILVLRKDGMSPFGQSLLSPVYVGTFSREMCERIIWDRPEAIDAILYAKDVAISVKGKTKELEALDPGGYRGLREVIAEVMSAYASSAQADGENSR